MKSTSERQDNPLVRVLVVDDHPMMRRGLRSFLTAVDGLECVGEAESGEEAVELCVKLKPQVVLMDLMMPGMGGMAAIKALRQRCPDMQVIVLTSFVDPKLVQEAVNAGAIGYLLKSVAAPSLAEAVRAAANGRPIMGPEAVEALIMIAGNPVPIGSDLTDREREVLRLLARGLTNNEIARAVGISEATVRFHVGNILSKLEVGNRTEAVRVAFKHGLMD